MISPSERGCESYRALQVGAGDSDRTTKWSYFSIPSAQFDESAIEGVALAINCAYIIVGETRLSGDGEEARIYLGTIDPCGILSHPQDAKDPVERFGQNMDREFEEREGLDIAAAARLAAYRLIQKALNDFVEELYGKA